MTSQPRSRGCIQRRGRRGGPWARSRRCCSSAWSCSAATFLPRPPPPRPHGQQACVGHPHASRWPLPPTLLPIVASTVQPVPVPVPQERVLLAGCAKRHSSPRGTPRQEAHPAKSHKRPQQQRTHLRSASTLLSASRTFRRASAISPPPFPAAAAGSPPCCAPGVARGCTAPNSSPSAEEALWSCPAPWAALAPASVAKPPVDALALSTWPPATVAGPATAPLFRRGSALVALRESPRSLETWAGIPAGTHREASSEPGMIIWRWTRIVPAKCGRSPTFANCMQQPVRSSLTDARAAIAVGMVIIWC